MTLKTKEQKTLSFNFKDAEGAVIDLIGATFSMVIEDSSGTEVITKSDTDFDKSLAVNGIAKVTLTSSDLDMTAGVYSLELKTIFPSGEVDKSTTFSVNLIQALING